MAYCNSQTLAGINNNDCLGSLGGIKKVYITYFDDNLYTMSGETVVGFKTGTTWYSYNFKPETSNFTSTLNKTAAGGSYVTTDITLVFSRMGAAKRAEMNALALDDLAVVVADDNGEYHAFGRWLPVTASAGTGETGTAYGDANQYTITLHASDQDFAPFLNETAIAELD